MKKILLAIAICCCFEAANSQDKKNSPDAPKSKLESFSDQASSMIKKEFFEIANVKGIQFQVLKITDLANNKTEAGLRIAARLGSTDYTSSYVAFLDKDEMDGFEKAVNFMLDEVVKSAVPENDVEYRFMSRSGFTATTFNGSGVWSSKKKWQLNLQLEKYISNSNAFLSSEDLPKVKEAIAAAKLKLQNI